MVLDDENGAGIFHAIEDTDRKDALRAALPRLSWDVLQHITTLANQNQRWGPKRILRELQRQDVDLDMVKAVLADLRARR
ncbi:hypothetical protein ACWDA3_24200 [Nonomuraea rubra]